MNNACEKQISNTVSADTNTPQYQRMEVSNIIKYDTMMMANVWKDLVYNGKHCCVVLESTF